ncbi:MAG: LacI family DNA-binding transcriptional regulator [Bacillota bacterium]
MNSELYHIGKALDNHSPGTTECRGVYSASLAKGKMLVPVTIDDVARAAGVSAKTVSRVLNHSNLVSPDTVNKVQRAMKSLGYEPNVFARGLATNSSDVIGVVIGHGADLPLSNPFLFDVLKGIGTTANRNGFQVLLVTAPNDVPYPALIAAKRVAGMIFISVGMNDPNVRAMSSENLPSVLTCHFDPSIDVNFVDVDSVRGAYMATRHLLDLGHRRIGLVCGPHDHASSRDRLAGYKKALEEHGVAYSHDLVKYGDFTEESGFQLVQGFFDQQPPITGIFLASDLMAIGAMRAIRMHGLRIPESFSVVGFDDISVAQYIDPPLTTVRQRGVDKGVLATEMLVKLIRKEPVSRRQVVLPPELVVRGSTGPVQSGA